MKPALTLTKNAAQGNSVNALQWSIKFISPF